MTKKNLIIVGFAAIVLYYLPVLFLPGPAVVDITLEDHLYENITALFFFIASVGFGVAFFKAKNRSLFYLLFALMFFFAAGEEISWGQRILHFAIPGWLAAANSQGEFNFHNLAPVQHEHGLSVTIKSLTNFNRLFILFYVGYAVLVPLADLYIRPLKDLFARLRLPVVSLWFGLLFLVNEVGCQVIELAVKGKIPDVTKIAEIKESLWATIVLLMALYFLSVYQRGFALQKQKDADLSRAAVP